MSRNEHAKKLEKVLDELDIQIFFEIDKFHACRTPGCDNFTRTPHGECVGCVGNKLAAIVGDPEKVEHYIGLLRETQVTKDGWMEKAELKDA